MTPRTAKVSGYQRQLIIASTLLLLSPPLV